MAEEPSESPIPEEISQSPSPHEPPADVSIPPSTSEPSTVPPQAPEGSTETESVVPVNNDNNPEPEPDPVPPPNPPQLPFPLRTVPNLGDLFKDQNKIENPHQSPWEINR